jgi:prophage antirepressor-like protein
MTNEIQIFNFKNNKIRTQLIDNEPWFCAKDVCDTLGILNTSKALQRFSQGVTSSYTLTKGGKQELKYINEQNLYKLVMRSDKPEAEPFIDWVSGEVLPSIRKTGSYDIQIPKTLPEALRAYALEVEEHEKAKKQIAQDKPKVEFVNKYVESEGLFSITVGFKQIGVRQKDAFAYLRNNGYIYKSNGQDIAKQRYVDMGLFHNAPVTANGRAFTQLKITSKGIAYFEEKMSFLDNINIKESEIVDMGEVFIK